MEDRKIGFKRIRYLARKNFSDAEKFTEEAISNEEVFDRITGLSG